MSSIKESVPLSTSPASGQWDTVQRSGTARGTEGGTNSLKALAERVLRRDSGGTTAGTKGFNPSQSLRKLQSAGGTNVQDFIDEIEERAATIQELYPTREAATAAAYEECKVKWRKL